MFCLNSFRSARSAKDYPRGAGVAAEKKLRAAFMPRGGFGSYFSGQVTTAERLGYVVLALAVLAYSSLTIGAELGLIAPPQPHWRRIQKGRRVSSRSLGRRRLAYVVERRTIRF